MGKRLLELLKWINGTPNVAVIVRQLIFLIIIGKLLFKIQTTWLDIVVILFVGIVIEHFFIYLKERKLTFFSISAINASLSTAIMLGAVHLWVYFVSLLIGLAQKHFLLFRGQHFLNPSNVAIVVGLTLFYKYTYALTVPFSGTTLWWIGPVLAFSAGIVMYKVRLLLIPLTFSIFHILLSFLFLTRNLQEILAMMNTGSFILFSFFILGDPKSLPKTKSFVVLFVFLTALFNIMLTLIWYNGYSLSGGKEVTPFLALLLSGLLVPLWRWLEEKKNTKKIFLSLIFVLFIIVEGLYLSPFNYLRNFERSYANSNPEKSAYFKNLDLTQRVADSTSCDDPNLTKNLWSKQDKEIYQAFWNAPHIVTRPLHNREADDTASKFILHKGEVERYIPHLTEENFEYALYSGISAGDLNHDGFLDLGLSRINRKVRILLNDQQGDFINITGCLFKDEVPGDVEYIHLSDFNNDTWLDLLVVHNQLQKKQINRIYFFDPQNYQFIDSGIQFGQDKKTVGGVTVWDINQDKKLDFYLSFGVDWQNPYPDYRSKPFPAEFYLSNESKGWQESLSQVFPKELQTAYVGMTVLFTDFNRDGRVDFLQGNDYTDPSLTLIGQDQGFALIDKNKIEANTKFSMSYLPVDLLNRGDLQLWENGISFEPELSNVATLSRLTGSNINEQSIHKELVDEIQSRSRGEIRCDQYTELYVYWFCNTHKQDVKARISNQSDLCHTIVSTLVRFDCLRYLNFVKGQHLSNVREFRFNPEIFPKQLVENIVLSYNASKDRYQLLPTNEEALFTNWTWAAYPFDVNNDGKLDIYLTNGFTIYSHNDNRLLINNSSGETLNLANMAKEYGVDLEDDSRGVIIADFDNSGRGDLIVNNFLTPAKHFKNKIAGDSIVVELRSRYANYYAIGAKVELKTTRSSQIREVNQGGIWNTAQPLVQHFGIPKDEEIKELRVVWPSGSSQLFTNLEKNKKYIIYE